MPISFAEFKGQQQFLGSVPIPGLSLSVPEGAGDSALVILNVPAAYAVMGSWTGGRGGVFNISVDGTVLPEYAEFDYVISMNAQNTPVRVPVTLVVAVPLKLKNQTVVAMAANCLIDSSASLSVLI